MCGSVFWGVGGADCEIFGVRWVLRMCFGSGVVRSMRDSVGIRVSFFLKNHQKSYFSYFGPEERFLTMDFPENAPGCANKCWAHRGSSGIPTKNRFSGFLDGFSGDSVDFRMLSSTLDDGKWCKNHRKF